MPAPESFQTARLRAEQLEPCHLSALQVLHRDPEAMAHLGGVRSEAETSRYLERNLAHWAEHGFGVWMLRLEDDPERTIGRVVLRWLHTESIDDVEVGFALRPRYWGRGLATEAGAFCVELAKNDLGLETLVGIVAPENDDSKRVLTKLGLHYERDTTMEGTRCLLYRMALTAEAGASTR